MHEASLVRSLLNQVAALAVQHGGGGVEEIRVELGPLSGVEPLLVESAFDRLVSDSPLCGARLRIDQVPLTGHCRDCDQTFPIERFRFRCRHCESPSVEIVAGDSFRLIDITLRQSEEITP